MNSPKVNYIFMRVLINDDMKLKNIVAQINETNGII